GVLGEAQTATILQRNDERSTEHRFTCGKEPNPLSPPKRADLVEVRKGHRPHSPRRCSGTGGSRSDSGSKANGQRDPEVVGSVEPGTLLDPAPQRDRPQVRLSVFATDGCVRETLARKQTPRGRASWLTRGQADVYPFFCQILSEGRGLTCILSAIACYQQLTFYRKMRLLNNYQMPVRPIMAEWTLEVCGSGVAGNTRPIEG